MNTTGKSISIEFDLLKQMLKFDFLQLFEVDNVDSPSCFTEYPVSAFSVPPKDPRFMIVSRRVMMRLKNDKTRPVVFVPKDELLPNWEFNVTAIFLTGRRVPLAFFFFSRHALSRTLDLRLLASAVRDTD